MKRLFFTMVMIIFAGCGEPAASTSTEIQFSTAEQKLSDCSSTCDPPTYNGVAVSCTSNTYCLSAPEAAYCQQPDGSYFTAACAPVRCGDGVCSASEGYSSCPADCAPVCSPGQTWCNGNCITTDDDFYNCGGCGIRCPNYKFECIDSECVYTF